MSQTVTAAITSLIKATFKKTTSLGTYTGTPNIDFERTFNSTETTLCYSNQYTVTTSPTVIDLTALTDDYGNAISFATVRHLLVYNHDTTNSLTVGGGTNPVLATMPTLAGYTASGGTSNGSCFSLTTNLTVDSTHKTLRLVAGAGSITVDVFVVGS